MQEEPEKGVLKAIVTVRQTELSLEHGFCIHQGWEQEKNLLIFYMMHVSSYVDWERWLGRQNLSLEIPLVYMEKSILKGPN